MNTAMTTLSTLFVAAAIAGAAQSTNVSNFSAPPNLPIITITYVQKPWYAWKNLVVGKMEQSVPEYSGIKGLQQKFYSFTADYDQFGGIYFWHSKTDAQRWFDEKWFERTAEKYGKRGIVEYYQVVSLWQNKSLASGKQSLWATISKTEDELKLQDNHLLLIARLKDEQNNSFTLAIWKTKESAEKLGRKYKTTYFDLPLALIKP